MSRQEDIETRLKEVLDCVARIHRRESNSRALARKAEAELEQFAGLTPIPAQRRWRSRIRNALTGWLRTDRLVRMEPGDTAHRSPGSDTVSFHGGTVTSIPLTLEPQRIRIPPCETAKELWVTALTASDRARPAFEFLIDPGESGARGFRVRGMRTVRLLPFRPHRLMKLALDRESLVVRVARTEGNFCVLKLELTERGSARAAELEAAAATPESCDDRGPKEALSPEPKVPLPGSAAPCTAAALDQQLWGGYAACALPALERLKFDPTMSIKERAKAAWTLTRWHFAAQNYAPALAEIQFAKSLQRPLTPRFVLAEARCLLHVGRCDEAMEVLQSPHSRAMAADFALLESTAVRQRALLNDRGIKAAEALQLERINLLLCSAALAPITKKRAGNRLSLANICSRAQPGRASQSRKVSVVMPAFNAEASIAWALGSLLAQTWENLEVIVVDDASEDATAERVADIAARDPRVRLIRLESNKGSYCARNAGARLATGDLLMIHDADDWSHPQYIERQMEILDAYPSTVGVKSHWVRVNESLEVIGGWMPRDSILELNFSSLMFRREILDVLGGWDEVRVAGDAEFYSRVRAVYGEQSIITAPRNCPLVFSLTRQDSLTRSSATHLRSMYHGLRRNYMDAYRWWHARLDRNADLPISTSSGKRAFPVPLGNVSEPVGSLRFGLVVIADYASSCAAFDNALAALVAASRAGGRVAALHWRHSGLPNRAALQSEFYQICVEHGVAILSAGDSVNADTVMIASPALLEQVPSPNAAIHADNVIVLVDSGPRAAGAPVSVPGGSLGARHNLVEVFANEGKWLPTSVAAARLMREDRHCPPPATAAWLPLVDCQRLTSRPIRWRGGDSRPPVVGRRIVGDLDWPSRRSELDLIYGAAAAWDVRFHSDNAELRALLRDAPAHWQIVPRHDVSGIEFARELDFYVHYPHELYADELSQGLLDAMALGIPVIVPPRYQSMLGDAATYAAAEDVTAAVERLWSHEREYLERAAAGRNFVLQTCGMDGFLSRLQSACAGESTVVPFERNTVARSVS